MNAEKFDDKQKELKQKVCANIQILGREIPNLRPSLIKDVVIITATAINFIRYIDGPITYRNIDGCPGIYAGSSLLFNT